MTDGYARIVLVIGGSEGLGADVARHLADDDTHVVLQDIADEASSEAMIESIIAQFGRLDALVLTASELDPGCAMRVNRDAQRRLAMTAVPVMPVGGRIVYVTSHQAHFFPHKAVPKGYTAVAASMRAAETALYAMRDELHRAGVHLTVVSGDMADGTLAQAVVAAANTPNPTGMVYLGKADYLMTA
jgi:NAD(P)-dependent dehydrogenase (short-subunit alcohol dehydrogenase family)